MQISHRHMHEQQVSNATLQPCTGHCWSCDQGLTLCLRAKRLPQLLARLRGLQAAVVGQEVWQRDLAIAIAIGQRKLCRRRRLDVNGLDAVLHAMECMNIT